LFKTAVQHFIVQGNKIKVCNEIGFKKDILKGILMRLIVSVVALILGLGVLQPAKAFDRYQENTDGTLFFETLQDVPVMQGLVELEDYTLVFDKPEGRIIEMVAKIEDGNIDDTRQFYRRSLPQLGWSRSSEDHYIRGDEHLYLNFEREAQEAYLRITVEPR
tara:strand:+ start:657 stop:1142 length:486 start_codon:yes stop_codon:yes gene_type:complete